MNILPQHIEIPSVEKRANEAYNNLPEADRYYVDAFVDTLEKSAEDKGLTGSRLSAYLHNAMATAIGGPIAGPALGGAVHGLTNPGQLNTVANGAQAAIGGLGGAAAGAATGTAGTVALMKLLSLHPRFRQLRRFNTPELGKKLVNAVRSGGGGGVKLKKGPIRQKKGPSVAKSLSDANWMNTGKPLRNKTRFGGIKNNRRTAAFGGHVGAFVGSTEGMHQGGKN